MRVTADRRMCVGAGLCVMTAGHLFGQAEDDGLVVVLAPIEGADEVKVREAEQLCPSGALRIVAE